MQCEEGNNFLIQPKYNSMQIQKFQHWYSKCRSKKICQVPRNMIAN